jgi:hypothetical protein
MKERLIGVTQFVIFIWLFILLTVPLGIPAIIYWIITGKETLGRPFKYILDKIVDA